MRPMNKSHGGKRQLGGQREIIRGFKDRIMLSVSGKVGYCHINVIKVIVTNNSKKKMRLDGRLRGLLEHPLKMSIMMVSKN